MKTELEYYFCLVGPAYSSENPWGGSFPMGEGIKEVFNKTVGHYPDVLLGGWGVKNKDEVSFATYSDDLKKSVINSYGDERLQMPRYMQAWNLLFKLEEQKHEANSNI